MELNIHKLWTDSLKLIRDEVTDVAFKTWFLDIKIHEEEESVIFSFPNPFNKDIVESRYSVLIENVLLKAMQTQLKIKYCNSMSIDFRKGEWENSLGDLTIDKDENKEIFYEHLFSELVVLRNELVKFRKTIKQLQKRT